MYPQHIFIFRKQYETLSHYQVPTTSVSLIFIITFSFKSITICFLSFPTDSPAPSRVFPHRHPVFFDSLGPVRTLTLPLFCSGNIYTCKQTKKIVSRGAAKLVFVCIMYLFFCLWLSAQCGDGISPLLTATSTWKSLL